MTSFPFLATTAEEQLLSQECEQDEPMLAR
jgi:hypothetical protein